MGWCVCAREIASRRQRNRNMHDVRVLRGGQSDPVPEFWT